MTALGVRSDVRIELPLRRLVVLFAAMAACLVVLHIVVGLQTSWRKRRRLRAAGHAGRVAGDGRADLLHGCAPWVIGTARRHVTQGFGRKRPDFLRFRFWLVVSYSRHNPACLCRQISTGRNPFRMAVESAPDRVTVRSHPIERSRAFPR